VANLSGFPLHSGRDCESHHIFSLRELNCRTIKTLSSQKVTQEMQEDHAVTPHKRKRPQRNSDVYVILRTVEKGDVGGHPSEEKSDGEDVGDVKELVEPAADGSERYDTEPEERGNRTKAGLIA
jgi:hypothetical protein